MYVLENGIYKLSLLINCVITYIQMYRSAFIHNTALYHHWGHARSNCGVLRRTPANTCSMNGVEAQIQFGMGQLHDDTWGSCRILWVLSLPKMLEINMLNLRDKQTNPGEITKQGQIERKHIKMKLGSISTNMIETQTLRNPASMKHPHCMYYWFAWRLLVWIPAILQYPTCGPRLSTSLIFPNWMNLQWWNSDSWWIVKSMIRSEDWFIKSFLKPGSRGPWSVEIDVQHLSFSWQKTPTWVEVALTWHIFTARVVHDSVLHLLTNDI